MRKRILLIHAGVPTDTESARTSRRSFAELGYELDEFSIADPDPGSRLAAYLAQHGAELAFFFSSNDWAFLIRAGTALLHTATGIPLVMMMHDHPIYFRHRMTPEMNGIVIFAPDEFAPDFIAKYYPVEVKTVPNVGSIPHFEGAGDEPSFADFTGRHNVLLAPMNLMIHGLNIDGAWAQVAALPEPRKARAVRLIDAILYDYATPLHLVSERLAAAGDPEIEVEDLRWVLNFVKLWRRNKLVRMLIDLPILIGSEYVPGDLAFRYPEKFKQSNWIETIRQYRQYRFVLNLNALLTNTLHDRVTNSLFGNAVCLTDPGAFVSRYFQDGRDMIFIDLNADMAAKISPYLDDPERAFALTVNAYHTRRSHDFAISSYRALIEEIEAIWAARGAAA